MEGKKGKEAEDFRAEQATVPNREQLRPSVLVMTRGERVRTGQWYNDWGKPEGTSPNPSRHQERRGGGNFG